MTSQPPPLEQSNPQLALGSVQGRPSKYRDCICDEIVQLGRTGMEVAEMADFLGVGLATLYRWSEKHEDFREAFARAREASEAFHTRQVRAQLLRPARETNASAYLSYMARRFPSWRERSPIDQGPRPAASTTLANARMRAAARSKPRERGLEATRLGVQQHECLLARDD